MDTVTLALGFGIVIILILVMNCWNAPYKKSCSAGSKEGMENQERASSGQAVKSREMQRRLSELKNLESYDDYGELVQFMALEPNVFASHNQYASDINQTTSGASIMSETSHDPDSGWVVRRPAYREVPIRADVRQEFSVYQEQLPDTVRTTGFY